MFHLESIGGHFAKTIILFQAFAWEINFCLSFHGEVQDNPTPRRCPNRWLLKFLIENNIKSAYNQSNVGTPFEHPQIAYGLIKYKRFVNGLILCCLGNADKDIMDAHIQCRQTVPLSMTECRQQKPGCCVPWLCGRNAATLLKNPTSPGMLVCWQMRGNREGRRSSF